MNSMHTMGLPESGLRLKGNLHTHTTNSDGALTPAEAVAGYRAHGYDFLCLSDHDMYTDYRDEFDADGFTILPGLEASAYLYADETRTTKLACHHIHGILGPDARIDRAARTFEHGERLDPIECVGSWDGPAVAQQLVDRLTEHGCIAAYNHPLWSRIDATDLDGVRGLFGIEVCNYGTVNQCGLGVDTSFWDRMLVRGMRVAPVAGDDAHNHGRYSDAFGGWIVVCAQERSRDAIVQALADQAFYASSGPAIENYGVDGDRAWIACSPCERVTMIAGGPVGVGRTHVAPSGTTLSEESFELKGTETYIRFECCDAHGATAWSGALFL